MLPSEFLKRFNFWIKTDRIGPDIPGTHWMLYFRRTMLRLCKRKFKHFDDSAEFRPGAYAVCCSNISIGRRVVIRPASMLFAEAVDNDAGIIIEDDVLIGSGVHLNVANHRYHLTDRPIIDQGHTASMPITLRKGCWIGANCVILPGVTIGENAVVGAGSVVTKSVPGGAVAAGNPAKVIKEIN